MLVFIMRGNAMNHKTIVMDRVTFILIYIVNFKNKIRNRQMDKYDFTTNMMAK